jgi:hypothetical protein
MPVKNSFFKSVLGYEGKTLATYKYQLAIQNELLNVVKSALPNHLSSHALYCVATGKKITLYTDSATWSSQLRFYHQSILRALSTSNNRVFEALQIKIIPQTIERKQKKTLMSPSRENIDLILSQAEHQTDKKLKAALLKLGRTFKKLT